MKKDIASYIIISLRLIMFNIHLVFAIFCFLVIAICIQNLFALLFAIIGFIHLPICNKLLSVSDKSNRVIIKILSVLGAILLAIVVLLYDVIFALGAAVM